MTLTEGQSNRVPGFLSMSAVRLLEQAQNSEAAARRFLERGVFQVTSAAAAGTVTATVPPGTSIIHFGDLFSLYNPPARVDDANAYMYVHKIEIHGAVNLARLAPELYAAWWAVRRVSGPLLRKTGISIASSIIFSNTVSRAGGRLIGRLGAASLRLITSGRFGAAVAGNFTRGLTIGLGSAYSFGLRAGLRSLLGGPIRALLIHGISRAGVANVAGTLAGILGRAILPRAVPVVGWALTALDGWQAARGLYRTFTHESADPSSLLIQGSGNGYVVSEIVVWARHRPNAGSGFGQWVKLDLAAIHASTTPSPHRQVFADRLNHLNVIVPEQPLAHQPTASLIIQPGDNNRGDSAVLNLEWQFATRLVLEGDTTTNPQPPSNVLASINRNGGQQDGWLLTPSFPLWQWASGTLPDTDDRIAGGHGLIE